MLGCKSTNGHSYDAFRSHLGPHSLRTPLNSSSFALHGLNERAGAEQAKDGSLFRQLVASQPILLISEIERARAGAGRPSVIDASGNGIKLCYGSGLQIWNKIVD